MIERKELNKLVVLTLTDNQSSLKASQLYEQIKKEEPSIMREERVRGFKSFVKIINSFKGIKPIGSGVKRYTIYK